MDISTAIQECDNQISINPTKELSLITDDLAQMQIEGAALLDPTKPVNATLGQFGAIYQQ